MDNKEEIWKKVDGFEEYYQVSSFGRINSLRRDKILKPIERSKNGYVVVTLCKEKKRHPLYIHRIVATHFNERREDQNEVNHKDGNKQNNFSSNLEWATRSENVRHSYKTGLQRYTENHRKAVSKFNKETKSKKVLQYDLSGNFIKEHPSAAEAARLIGGSKGNVSSCCLESTKCQTVKGFVFKYKNCQSESDTTKAH